MSTYIRFRKCDILRIPVATEFLLRHPRYDISANVRSLSEQLFGFTSDHHLETSIEAPVLLGRLLLPYLVLLRSELGSTLSKYFIELAWASWQSVHTYDSFVR